MHDQACYCISYHADRRHTHSRTEPWFWVPVRRIFNRGSVARQHAALMRLQERSHVLAGRETRLCEVELQEVIKDIIAVCEDRPWGMAVRLMLSVNT